MLTGSIPGWIGEHLRHLRLLRLRSNKFHGAIPRELAQLSYLQILDLAHNNLSGSIPRSFSNFTAMIREHKSSRQPFVHSGSSDRIGYAYVLLRSTYVDRAVIATKGRELEYDKTLFLVTSLDLSSNNLSGDIPEELTNLVGLRSLNLSKNQLTGEIPSKIGDMRNLETFDLSKNKLSGAIPSSISSLNSLVHLNLSNNGLSRRIPSGNQLWTLTDPSIYEGNPDLCGFPL
ncbi:hypothetical protein Taro_045089 [Colocasia esculenta]|uniref:Uncharacterized protein n=1 Tax=Colocasia esculenta TaxID=4460 RepID=A0A843WVQ1_COLES|nr:hypothetical protein [Colocasia esculenta]